MDIQYGGLIGLYGGLLCAVIGWYIGQRKNEVKKDEVQKHIYRSARSFSWFATIAAIYILFTLYGIGIPIELAMALGIILLVQFGSFGISIIVLNAYFNMDKPINEYYIIGISMMVVPLILFTTIALLIDNWIYILCALPLFVVGLCFIYYGDKWKAGGH